MKKILQSLITILIIFYLIIFFISFSYNIGYTFIKGSTTVGIVEVNNEHLEKGAFINFLNANAKSNNIDLIYLETSSENKTQLLEYYITNNIGTYSKYEKQIDDNGYLNYPSYFNKSKIHSFDEINTKNLNAVQLFVIGERESVTTFLSSLKSRGYNAYFSTYYKEEIPPFINGQLLISIIITTLTLFIVFVLYQNEKRKEILIKKMNGFSLNKMLFQYLKEFNFFLSIVMICMLILNTIIFIIFHYNIFLYFKNYFILNIILFIIFNTFYIFTFNLTFKFIKTSKLKKNKVSKKTIYTLSMFKVLLVIITMILLTSLHTNITGYLDVKSNYLKSRHMYEEYSPLSFSSSTLVNDGTIMDVQMANSTEKFKQLYYKTADELDGVLASFTSKEEIKTTDTILNKHYIGYINKNYLKHNKIKLTNDKELEITKLPSDKLVYLVPEKYKNNEKLNKELNEKTKKYCVNQEESKKKQKTIYYKKCNIKYEIMYIKDNTKFYKLTGEEVDDAIVTVITQSKKEEIDRLYNLGDEFESILEKGDYIVKTNKENPYSVVKKYLKEVGLDTVIPKAPLLSEKKLKALYSLKKEILMILFSLFILITSTTICLYYLVKIRIIYQRKKFAIKVLNGSKKHKILKKEITTILLTYLFIFIISASIKQFSDLIILNGQYKIDSINGISLFSIIFLLSIVIYELYLWIALFNKTIKNKLNQNLKGGLW